ncbi:MAG TPA: BrnA antitoxin family protein [Bacteroidota bacterium]|nr:BrnA antitoxin family protein [Bacteroidota bacterium]
MKKVPKFKSKDEERKFWSKHSPLDYVDPKKVRLSIFPNLKPTSKTISIRLPESLVESIKVLANKKDVPYQLMLKILLAEKVREELTISRKRIAAG